MRNGASHHAEGRQSIAPPGPRHEPPFRIARAVRTAVGGAFMGVANLIPGVSGGTMILAIGLYEEFIDSVADVTALRLRPRRLVFLAVLFAFAGLSIVSLSKVILYLLLWHSSAMFALFIGLTLGGTPLLLKMIGRFRPSATAGALAGFAVMAAVAFVKAGAGSGMPHNPVMDFFAGLVGATTMVLPGISGSYMLLILDQYDRVVGAIADFKDVIAAGGAGWIEPFKIITPVGLGAAVGIVGLSNLLKYLLHHFEKATLGFLLGLLLGSVLGLWPFGRPPTEKILDERGLAELRAFAAREGIAASETLAKPELIEHVRANWPQRTADPYAPAHLVTAVVMLLAGLAATVLLGRFGSETSPPARSP